MVQRQALDLVQWQQNLHQELLVFRLQGQSKPVYDAAQYFEQLAHAVKVFRLVDESQENVVYLFPDERT